MKYKNLTLVLLAVMLIALSSAIYLFFELTDAKTAAIEISGQKAAELEDTLAATKIKNKELRDSINILKKQISGIPPENKDSNGQIISIAEEVEIDTKPDINARTENADFFLGLYALTNEDQLFDKTLRSLEEAGFNIIAGVALDQRQSWLSSNSTVFYYSNSSENKAQSIAKNLKKITGIQFDIKWGAGLGVPPDKKDRYFYVHLIK